VIPTAAKLVAGLGLGATAVIVAYIFSVQQNSQSIARVFIGGNFFVGLVVGWVTLGRRPGRTNLGGGLAGLVSVLTLMIVSGLVFNFLFIMTHLGQSNMHEPLDLPLLMLERSVRYIGEAVVDMRVLVPLLIGGALTGLASFQASIRWR